MQGRDLRHYIERTRPAEAIRHGLHRLIAWARWLLEAGPHLERGRLHREVMRLEVVAGGGHTPNSYGWHVDALLNVGVHYPSDPVVASEESPEGNRGLPARPPESHVYRVPRSTQRQSQLKLGGAHT